MSYWTYYFIWTLAAYALRQPWLLGGVAVFLLLRRIIPDPGALFRALSRSGALRTQVELNAANVTARRDLAQIYLDVLRPRAALALVEQALARTPNEPELLYLAGVALHRIGRHDEALPKLVRAVELDPRVRFGMPYLVAGDALFALGRNEEAVDAYERYQETNTSDVAGYIRLARAHARLGNAEAAKEAVDEAQNTWRVLPSRMKRRGFFKGYFAPLWARVWVLRQPGAVAAFLLVLFALAGVGAWSYPAVAKLSHSVRTSSYDGMNDLSDERRALLAAFSRCGSQSTGAFEGRYLAMDPPPLPIPSGATTEQLTALSALERNRKEQLEHFEIRADRIRSGVTLVQEFCLTKTIEHTPERLRAEALWHEDVNDPGDASLVELRLTRNGDTVRVAIAETDGTDEEEVAIVRRRE